MGLLAMQVRGSKNFLADKPFEVINWLGNSPDLNPIENCWNYLQDEGPRLRPQVHHCHQDALSQGPVQGLPEEAESLDVQEDPEGAGCEGGRYQLLII
jgi:hypothetical protein